MRRIAIALLVLAACRSASTPAPARRPMTGAAQPRAAVEGFLAAVRAQDLQAMSTIWGSERGPARDIISDRTELEKRELVMQCYLAHDRFRILGDSPGEKNQRKFRVELSKGELTRTTSFTAVPGPAERWYVLDADLEPVKDLCKSQ